MAGVAASTMQDLVRINKTLQKMLVSRGYRIPPQYEVKNVEEETRRLQAWRAKHDGSYLTYSSRRYYQFDLKNGIISNTVYVEFMQTISGRDTISVNQVKDFKNNVAYPGNPGADWSNVAEILGLNMEGLVLHADGFYRDPREPDVTYPNPQTMRTDTTAAIYVTSHPIAGGGVDSGGFLFRQMVADAENVHEHKLDGVNLVQHFEFNNLRLRPVKNALSTEVRLLTPEEAVDMLNEVNVAFTRLELYRISDPVVRWHGWRLGDIVEIISDDDTMASAATERLVHRLVIKG